LKKKRKSPTKMFSMPASPAKDYEFESQTAIDISKKKNFKKKGV
jgi:hypothetical protein